ncbi:MAG TPA: hypothetical protein VMM36_13340 [Opitutaceae bacterium]|nr:hypothetical protein [Opitutaceae bacterium]
MSAALALQVLFMMLGAGLGFAIYSPLTAENPVANLGVGAMLIQGISAVVSLWFGGWVAGRFSPVRARATGWLHGFSVWCVATVAGVLVVAFGAGWMLGDLSKLVGGGLSAAGQPAAAVAGGAVDLAADAVKQSGETITSFVDEAVGNRPADGAVSEGIRAKREIGFAVARLFNPAQEGNTDANRAAAVTALVDHTGMSQADADRAVTEWTATFDRLQADLAAVKEAAAAKAREAADTAANALAIFSLCAFVGFLLGALSASWGGSQGAKCATWCEEKTAGALSTHDTSGLPIRPVPVAAS